MHIELTRGYVALIDDEDAPLVSSRSWEASIAPTGIVYAQHARSDGERIKMHRLITGVQQGLVVDHRDGNGLNNTRRNLRVCSQRDNTRHRVGYVARKRAAGGFLGVSYNKRVELWTASIHAGPVGANGEATRISLKCYASAEEAARVYDSAARHYFREFAALNFPEEEPTPFSLSALRGSSKLSPEQRAAKSRANMAKARAARWKGLDARLVTFNRLVAR